MNNRDIAARQRRHMEAQCMGNLTYQLNRARTNALTPRQEELVHLYFDQGHTMPQIAQELGVNVSTVSRTLLRARTRLQRYFS